MGRTRERDRKKHGAWTTAGILVLAALAALTAGSPVHADGDGREAVLESAEVEGRGRIRGRDGFLYDGGDIQSLADGMSLLYRLCQ